MKKSLHITLLLALSSSLLTLSAQTMGKLWGITPRGGHDSTGVLFNYDPVSTNDSVAFTFDTARGLQPYYSGLVKANDGNYYGTTSKGGIYGQGTLFRLTPTGQVTVIHNFKQSSTNGANPYSGVILGQDGFLYGVTYIGGTNYYGILYKCSTTGNFSIVHNFTYPEGGYNYCGLVQAPNGNFYGMCSYGGSNGIGTIYKCTPSGVLTVLHNFTGGSSDGQTPYSILALSASSSSMYGMTLYGGTSNIGGLFKCDTAGNFSFLHSFTGNPDGSYPYSNLVMATNDTLYGTTEAGGLNNEGTLFRCDTNGSLAVIHSFSWSDGAYPYGGINLIDAGNDTLYGIAYDGGLHGAGVIYKSSYSGNESVIYNFQGGNNDGAYSYGGIFLDNNTFWGMTEYGGTNNNGVIYKCSTLGNESVLYNYGGSNIGGVAANGLTQANDGNMYGVSEYGGQHGTGSVYRVTPAGVVTNIYSFAQKYTGDGFWPNTSLLLGSDGNLYGTTRSGGSYNDGTLFRVTTSGTETIVHNFTGGSSDGYYPTSGVIQDSNGALYGTTVYGGSSNYGVLYKCSMGGNFNIVHTFTGGSSDGQYPYSDITQGSSGMMYGMTEYAGASSNGTIFSCDTLGNFNILHSFTGSGVDGAYPYGGKLVKSINGKLYGVTQYYGGSYRGAFFSCTTSGTETLLNSFSNSSTDGEYPISIIEGTDSNLYGMTMLGGTNGKGTIFKMDTLGNETVLVSLNDTGNGDMPQHGNQLMEYMSASISSSLRCLGYTLTASVKGGGTGMYHYMWSTGSTTDSTINITASGMYSVSVTSNKGVTVTASIFVPGFTPLQARIGTIIGLCSGGVNNATANSDPLGGFTPYTYSWSAGAQTNATATGLSAGSYTVTVKDAMGCSSTASNTVFNVVVDTMVIQHIDTIWSHDYVATYQWLNCDKADTIIPGAIGQYYIAKKVGDYAVVVTKNGCSDTSRCVHVSSPEGINDVSSPASAVNIYPLPNNGHFAITLNGTGYKAMTIYDEMGKMVMTQSLQDESINSTLNIDMSNYADGIYFVQVITDHGTLNKKVIIQK